MKRRNKAEIRQRHVRGKQKLIWTNDKHISVIGRPDNICLQKIIEIINIY